MKESVSLARLGLFFELRLVKTKRSLNDRFDKIIDDFQSCMEGTAGYEFVERPNIGDPILYSLNLRKSFRKFGMRIYQRVYALAKQEVCSSIEGVPEKLSMGWQHKTRYLIDIPIEEGGNINPLALPTYLANQDIYMLFENVQVADP